MSSCQARVALATIMLLAISGCTPHVPSSKEHSEQPSPASLRSELRCEDAWEGNPTSAPDAPTAEGVSSLAWQGSPPNYSWPIKNETNGQAYKALDGSTRGAWKAPITVDAGLGKRVVSVISPADAEIVVAAATEWESNQALREGRIRLPSSYTINACESRLTQFPGMILVGGPSCVVIKVTNQATGKSSTVSVPMYGANCT